MGLGARGWMCEGPDARLLVALLMAWNHFTWSEVQPLVYPVEVAVFPHL